MGEHVGPDLGRLKTIGRDSTVDLGGRSSDGLSFTQSRLALYGLVMLLLALVGYVATNVVTHLGRSFEARDLLSNTNVAHLGAALVFLVTWLLARGRTLQRPALAAIDAVGTVLAVAFLDLMALALSMELRPDLASRHLVMALATSNVLLARSVFIPSTPRFTFVVGVLTAMPALAFAGIAGGPGDTIPRIAYTFTWCAIAVVTSTIGSQVIYGLRQRVQAARLLGKYRLGARIGAGSMGVVYRAEHAMLRRPTAIKLLDSNAVGERGLARFEREVQVTAQLTHPNTVAIYDFGRTSEGVFYYAMELIDGIDLQTLVERHGPQPPERVVTLLCQVAGSLSEAHACGLVHRDIKPANLIVTLRPCQGDIVKVLDFGLVKSVTTDDLRFSSGGVILGTPHYLSPEAINEPQRVGPRSDLYALGGVAYFLLTGREVFEGTSVVELCAAQVMTQPVPPSQRTEVDVPESLEDIVLRCLAKSPEDRPADADALARELAEAIDGRWTSGDAERWWREVEGREFSTKLRPSHPTGPDIEATEAADR